MQVHIRINLYASLQKFTPNAADRYPLEPGTSVQDLLQQLGIPENEVRLIFVNGIRNDPTVILQRGDRVGIFPPLGGG